MKKILLFLSIILIINGCDLPRDLLVPTHLTRVPKPYNLRVTVDSSKQKKYYVALAWDCDENGNVRNYEVSRAFLKSIGDTSQFFPIPPSITEKKYIDSSLAKITVDSTEYFYRVTVSGNDRFLGPSSEYVGIKLFKQ